MVDHFVGLALKGLKDKCGSYLYRRSNAIFYFFQLSSATKDSHKAIPPAGNEAQREIKLRKGEETIKRDKEARYTLMLILIILKFRFLQNYPLTTRANKIYFSNTNMQIMQILEMLQDAFQKDMKGSNEKERKILLL